MKCTFKSLLLVLATTLCSTPLFAHDFKVDGIYYNITSVEDMTVEVTYGGTSSNFYSNEYSGTVTIPESVTYNEKSYSVTSIGYEAFYDCSGLTSITIPNSVTSIGDEAFYVCSGLTSITIPNSVTSIGNGAFYDCDGLTSITIPNSVTSIGEVAFSCCTSLTSITIPNSVTSIGDNAFSSCTSLTSISIPNSMTSIGNGAFYNCYGLTSISIPNSVTSIGNGAFYNCYGLTSITIPNSVASIGKSAFFGCTGLTSISIPNSVTSIGEHAFDGTAWYKNQPDGVLYAGKVLYIYKGTMPRNTSIEVKEGTVSISHSAFEVCRRMTSITIPNSVTSIGDMAFSNCSGLTSITIPNSVTSIGDYAFYNCYGLTSITIGDGVTSIGFEAFYGCSALTEFISHIPAEKLFPVSSYVFYNLPSSSVLTVPAGAKATYEATEGWSVFNNIVEMEPTNIVLQEGVDFINEEPFDARSVTYSRKLPNMMWNALYLPVQIPIDALGDDYDVAYFNDMHAYDRNGDGVVDEMNMEIFLIKEGTLRANYPYFIRAKNEAAKQLNLELTNVTVQNTDTYYRSSVDVSSAFMSFELAGVYERHEGTELEGCYAITAKGAWAPIATNSYLNPYRLYLKMTPRPGSPVIVSPQALQTIRISVQGEDELTAIEAPIVNGQKSTEIYDLQGRRVTNPKKGMYIVNGKKVMF